MESIFYRKIILKNDKNHLNFISIIYKKKNKMKVLITGSEGFIGSHLTEKLISLGYNVTALVQYNSFGNIGNLKFLTKDKIKNCNIEFADIRDEDKILKLGKNKDIIIHLAAFKMYNDFALLDFAKKINATSF